MLHEVLVQLMTYNKSSTDIIRNLDNRASGFLHPGELKIYNDIMVIAADHSILHGFCRKYQCRVEVKSEIDLPKGLFLQAVARGVDLALTPYRNEVVALEKQALMNPKMSLSTILAKMCEFRELLYILKNIVTHICEKRLHGCQILDLVYGELLTGSEMEKQAVTIVFEEVHKILYKYLTYWLFNGTLNDMHKEFFIEKVNLIEVTESKINSDVSVESTFLETPNKCSQTHYQINIKMLPSYIPETLAANILFIGRTILMFKTDPRDHKINIMADLKSDYYKKITSIEKNREFNITILECTINEIKVYVSQHLFKLIMQDADLMKHLSCIKDYYFLGRGELFLEFIKLGSKILNELPSGNPNGTRDINVAFILAARNMFIGEEAESFRFVLPCEKQEDFALDYSYTPVLPIDKMDGWSTLILNYSTKWPLHLLFTPAVMDRYNTIFRFLLKVKRTQYDLHHIWLGQRSESYLYRYPKIWQLRHQWIFLIEHLQYYLHVDVVESQMSILQNVIKNTANFDDIQRAHAVFQSNVMSQCFLLIGSVKDPVIALESQLQINNPVHQILNKVFESCSRFCMDAAKWSEQEIMSEADLQDLDNIKTCFTLLIGALLKLLSTLKSQPCGTHLSKLLLRLDFNRWFSTLKNAPELQNYDISFEKIE